MRRIKVHQIEGLTPGGGGGGGRVLLSEAVLDVNAASISFPGGVIPTSGYRHLVVEILGRTTEAVTNGEVFVQINGDTTDANYSRQNLIGFGSSHTASSADGIAKSRAIGLLAGASSTAGVRSLLEVTFVDYLDATWHKIAGGRSVGQAVAHYYVRRKNTAAVTSVAFTATGSFVTGTTARLYGITE